ncbi:unnamed protein product [Closterium sp. NIES-65]|nr:unnamed protein product [Closterium sp. NIES-65]
MLCGKRFLSRPADKPPQSAPSLSLAPLVSDWLLPLPSDWLLPLPSDWLPPLPSDWLDSLASDWSSVLASTPPSCPLPTDAFLTLNRRVGLPLALPAAVVIGSVADMAENSAAADVADDEDREGGDVRNVEDDVEVEKSVPPAPPTPAAPPPSPPLPAPPFLPLRLPSCALALSAANAGSSPA